MRAALLGGAAILFPIHVAAQDTLPKPIVVQCKRKVATDTAAPVTTIDQREIDNRRQRSGVTLMNGSTPSRSGINARRFGRTTPAAPMAAC